MKKIKHLFFPFIILGILVSFLSSCSKVEQVEVDYSFTSAINVEQSINEYHDVQFNSFDDLNLGFFEGNVWIKFEIENSNQSNSFMVINNDMINRSYSFYKLDPSDGSLKIINQINDESKQDQRTYNALNPNFKIDLAPSEQATYLITTTSDGRITEATPSLISMKNYYRLTNESTFWSLFIFRSCCLSFNHQYISMEPP